MAFITTIETPLVIDLAVNTGLKKAYGMQYDNGTRKLIISLENKGAPYVIPPGVTVKLQGCRPDGAAIFKDCQVSNNQIHCVLTSYELAVPGDCSLNITLYEGTPNIQETFSGNRLSSFTFKVAVPKNPLDENAIVNSREFSVLTETILKAENALKNANEALDKANDMIEEAADLTEQNKELSNLLNTQIDRVNTGLTDLDEALNQADATLNEQINKIDSAITNQVNRVDEAIDATKEAISDVDEAIDRADAAAGRVDELADKYDKVNQYFVLKSEVGVPGGVASLGKDGLIPPEQLPEINTSSSGTGIYVSEELPESIETKEHWFKITSTLDPSDFDYLLSKLYPFNVRLTNLDAAVGICWSDPPEPSWTGTKLMKKEGSSWTELSNSASKNQYGEEPYIDRAVSNGTKYIYGIFPYSATEENTEPVYSITPTEILPNKLTNIQCSVDTNTLIPSFDKDRTVSRVVLVYKEEFIPNSITDGTVIDNYTSGTPITGLENDKKYGLRFFIYNERGRCNDSMEMALTAIPKYTVKLFVPEHLSIAQGQTIDLNWSVDPEAERENVSIISSVSTLTISSDKTQITAAENASIGDKVITFTLGDIVKETTVTISYAPYQGLVTNIMPVDMDYGIYIQFTKPSDCSGVILVQNEEHIPQNETDGISKSVHTTGINNITYFYQKTTPGKPYYYGLFPRNSQGRYNYNESQTLSFTTSPIYPVVPKLNAEVRTSGIYMSFVLPKININDTYPGAVDGFSDPRIPGFFFLRIRKNLPPEYNLYNKSYTISGFPTYGYTISNSNSATYYPGNTVSIDTRLFNTSLEKGVYYVQLYSEDSFLNRIAYLDSNLKELVIE